MRAERFAAILDLDGTLVDSNYHHALAWSRALREQAIVRPPLGGCTGTSGWW
ncbi:MAG: hypothetical protein WKF41_17485 [Gaiellaceae bacterium]